MLEARGPRSRLRERLGVWREVTSSLIDSHLVTVPSHCGNRVRQLSRVPFLRTVIPLMMAPSSLPNYFPKSLTPNNIILRNSISTYKVTIKPCARHRACLISSLSLSLTLPHTYHLSLAIKKLITIIIKVAV